MQSIKDFFSGFNQLLSESRVLKVLFFSFMGCFAIAMITFLITPYFHCDIFAYQKTCGQYFPSNTEQCQALVTAHGTSIKTIYCCGDQGRSICSGNLHCLEKPIFRNNPRCVNFLTIIWLSEVIGIVLSIPFFILTLNTLRKNSPKRKDYINLDSIAIVGKQGESNPHSKIQHYDNELNDNPNGKYN